VNDPDLIIVTDETGAPLPGQALDDPEGDDVRHPGTLPESPPQNAAQRLLVGLWDVYRLCGEVLRDHAAACGEGEECACLVCRHASLLPYTLHYSADELLHFVRGAPALENWWRAQHGPAACLNVDDFQLPNALPVPIGLDEAGVTTP
jgi:hypothetical protein